MAKVPGIMRRLNIRVTASRCGRFAIMGLGTPTTMRWRWPWTAKATYSWPGIPGVALVRGITRRLSIRLKAFRYGPIGTMEWDEEAIVRLVWQWTAAAMCS